MRRLHTHDRGKSRRTKRRLEVPDMNIGEIVREVEVIPVEEPAIPASEPVHEEPVREPRPA